MIELVLGIGLALMLVKYLPFIDAKCDSLNATNGSDDHSFYFNDKKIEAQSYMHITLVVFLTFLSLLNMLEYLTLAIGTREWLRKPDTSIRLSRKDICGRVVCVLLVGSGFVLLASGMLYFASMMEREEERCEYDNSLARVIGDMYWVHCALDFLKAILSCAVRVWMIIHTYKIKAIWSSTRSIKPLADVDGLLEANSFEELAGNAFFEEYEVKYKEKGRLAKNEMLPFVPWFLIPLVQFLAMSPMNPHLLLTPWTYNHDGQRSKIIAKARYFYLVIVLIKFTELLVQYGCVWRMDQYNQDYYENMEKNILYRYGLPSEDDSAKVKDFKKRYIVAASQKKIPFRDRFNFEPTFLSFEPKIQVENPLYILVLVFGLIVSASDILYK